MGARMKRRDRRAVQNAVFIAGVPVLNYDMAYDGHANLAEMSEQEMAAREQDWVLVMNPTTSEKEIQRLCDGYCIREGHPDKGGMAYLEVRATEGQLAQLIAAAKGAVQFVEPDGEVQMIPEIEGDVEAASWGLDRIAAPARAGGGDGVHVYVLDTGVRASHNDFGGRVVPTLDLTKGGLVECNGAANCAGDAQGHGTHCAGSAAGTSYGVAPGASISSVKVLSDQGSGSMSGIVAGIDWVARRSGPRVGSMSLGGPGVSQSFQTAIDSATRAGVTIVVAGGNDNSDSCNFSPAFVPSAITVGSTDISDRRSSFSNYGRCTDIWAPGSDILSAGHRSDTGTATLSGTSMACPHVAGGAALLLENNPGLTSTGVMSALDANAKKNQISGLKSGDTNHFLWVGGGAPSPTPPSPTPPSPTPPPTGGCVHETDCNVNPWCRNTGYEEWCRQQGQFGACPAPYCKRT